MNKKLKIMHVHNICSIPETISNLMDNTFNTESVVINLKKWDKYGHTKSFKNLNMSINLFIIWLVIKTRTYDIIHLHDRPYYLKYLRFVYPNKKLVIHYHGTSIRERWDERENEYSKANLIIVSTKDLLKNSPENVKLLLNPVDIDMFKKRDNKINGLALCRKYHAYDEVLECVNKHNLRLNIMPDSINYKYIPNLLRHYEYFIDIKRSTRINKLITRNGVLSMMGLQALSVGCKVIDSDGVIHEHLPNEHRPLYAVVKLMEYYQEMMLGD